MRVLLIGAGVLGPEAFDPLPFLDRLGQLGPSWELQERTPGERAG